MGISIWQLLIVLLIIVLLFGSKKLRSLGGDLGSAMRGFKKEMNAEDDSTQPNKQVKHDADFNQQRQQTQEKQEQEKQD